jgi:septal ring-binding cell division protein DamX
MNILCSTTSRTFGPAILGLLLTLLPAASGHAVPSVIAVPVSLDYPLLQHALKKQLFDTPDGSRDILDDPTGCNRIMLSEPNIGAQQDKLEIVARVKAQLGVGVLGGCQPLLTWHGAVGVLSLPETQPGGKSIKLAPQKIWLVDNAGNITSSGPLWEAGNLYIKNFLGSYVVDFAPYIETLEGFLPEVLPHRSAQQLRSMVNSISVSDIRVAPEKLNASITMAIAALPVQPAQPAPMLSKQELLTVETQWQMMDALLVGAIKQYASATQLQPLRDSLLDILIDSRYRLLDALNQPPDNSNDAVRHWFIDSWQRLGPVVRSIALQQPGQEPLLWFSVLTATDALFALDQLGPGIGLDISTNGLRRLARMINATQPQDMLRYGEEIDPELQQLLQEQFESPPAEPSTFQFNFSLFPEAHAATAERDLNRWIPTKDDLAVYLPRVSAVLYESADKVLKEDKLQPGYRKLYQNIVLATAWQESCWRQNVVIKKRIEPLRSDSGDVGIMQVNERVWRGFYDLQKLRWDINYNSSSGAEILLNYLVKHALKQGEQRHSGGISNLARSTYSAYNGGPSQVSRYRRSDVPSSHRKIDQLFWDKYQQVSAGHEMNVAKCLDGEVTTVTRPKTAAGAAAPAAEKKSVPRPAALQLAPKPGSGNAGKHWVLAQPAQNFTIQMGAFSTREAASKFIRQESLPDPVYVYPLQKGKTLQHLVLHGSFATRSNAGPAKKKYERLKPWLRRFGDLRQ